MNNIPILLLLLPLTVGFALGVWGTRLVRSAALRVENHHLRHEADDLRAVTLTLRKEVRLLHEKLVEVEAMNANQRDVIEHQRAIEELARQQSARLEAVRETAEAVRDGCLSLEEGMAIYEADRESRLERGQMMSFLDQEK